MCVKQAKRLAIYLVGLMILTCGQRLFVQAGLGAGAFDSLCVGVSQYNSISAGTWVTIGSFILMLVSAALEKRRPDWWVGVTTVVTAFAFGPVLQKYMELLDKKKFKILQWEKF